MVVFCKDSPLSHFPVCSLPSCQCTCKLHTGILSNMCMLFYSRHYTWKSQSSWFAILTATPCLSACIRTPPPTGRSQSHLLLVVQTEAHVPDFALAVVKAMQYADGVIRLDAAAGRVGIRLQRAWPPTHDAVFTGLQAQSSTSSLDTSPPTHDDAVLMWLQVQSLPLSVVTAVV